MSNLIEIKAIFVREFQRWDQTVLAECLVIGDSDSREKVTIRTTADLDELQDSSGNVAHDLVTVAIMPN